MKFIISFLLWITLTSCSTFQQSPKVYFTVEDLIGDEVTECEISFGAITVKECKFTIVFIWEVHSTTL
jgi:hypothetical protein